VFVDAVTAIHAQYSGLDIGSDYISHFTRTMPRADGGGTAAVTFAQFMFTFLITDKRVLSDVFDPQTSSVSVPQQPDVQLVARYEGLPVRRFELSGTAGVPPAEWLKAMKASQHMLPLAAGPAKCDLLGGANANAVRLVIACTGEAPSAVTVLTAGKPTELWLVMREVTAPGGLMLSPTPPPPWPCPGTWAAAAAAVAAVAAAAAATTTAAAQGTPAAVATTPLPLIHSTSNRNAQHLQLGSLCGPCSLLHW